MGWKNEGKVFIREKASAKLAPSADSNFLIELLFISKNQLY